ncbi:MAG: galactose mutarotase [Planctomycetes bacterium]|nr:galactose mutarotase [Planctomycetota bacterium]
MNIKEQTFGKTSDDKNIILYTLTNANGLTAKLINYGAILTTLELPGRDGKFTDVTLGYDTLEDYIKDDCYFGATVGRCANRIAKGKFTLNGKEYCLATNNGPNHLHGGIKGFNKVVWDAEVFEEKTGPAIKFTYLSKDNEEGYPGNLTVTVIYWLTNDNELKISYQAETDKSTPVNLTHHSYFNLAGHDSGDVLSHELTINADSFTETDETLVPTGEIKSVKDTPLDFTTTVRIADHINQVEGGFDHNYVLNNKNSSLTLAAHVYEPTTGRDMELYTTEPGVQFYSGNFLDGVKGKNGAVYKKHSGFCLETQHFPDSPNKPQFPSVILEPVKKYTQLTVYKFSVK